MVATSHGHGHTASHHTNKHDESSSDNAGDHGHHKGAIGLNEGNRHHESGEDEEDEGHGHGHSEDKHG